MTLRLGGDRAVLRLAALALTAAGSSSAADLQFWNLTEFTLAESRRMSWQVFAALRTRNHLTDAYDERLGTTVRLQANRRLSLSASYLRRWVDPEGHGFHRENRLYGGPTILLFEHPLHVWSVTLYERHIAIPGQADFNRYKQRIEIERARHGLSPFLAEEVTFLRQSFYRLRSRAGFRWRFHSGRSFELGYQFETIKTSGVLRPRHSIQANLSLGRLRQ